MTNTTDALPRKIALSDVWPAVPVHTIRPFGPCLHCGEAIATFVGPLSSDLGHVASERARCATEEFHIAAPVPTCPNCGGHELVTSSTDPWADYTRCPCGYERRVSL